MKVTGVSAPENSRPLTPAYGWNERWERRTQDTTDGRVRRILPAGDVAPGLGRGTGPPGPITTTVVPDMGADGTPPIGFEAENDISRATRYGESGLLSVSQGLLPTLVDRKA